MVISVLSARLLIKVSQRCRIPRRALPQQESDFACFKKHPLCGLLLRLNSPLHQFPLTKNDRKQLLCVSRVEIPGEATREFSSRTKYHAQESAKGGKRGKRIEPANQARITQQVISQYREAKTVKKKSKLLDAFTATTGYNRKYAMWLLNHAKVRQSTPQHTRRSHYGPEVQHALFLVWHAANRICTKRLIPFLPTLVEALERHEHLHLTEECHSQLLSMSAATADRLLRSLRKRGQRGLSTTRAGTMLKQQIPIRTFQEWSED